MCVRVCVRRDSFSFWGVFLSSIYLPHSYFLYVDIQKKNRVHLAFLSTWQYAVDPGNLMHPQATRQCRRAGPGCIPGSKQPLLPSPLVSDSLPFPDMSYLPLLFSSSSKLGSLRGCEVSGCASLPRPGAPTLGWEVRGAAQPAVLETNCSVQTEAQGLPLEEQWFPGLCGQGVPRGGQSVS